MKIRFSVSVVPTSGSTTRQTVELEVKEPTVADVLARAGISTEKVDITVNGRSAELGDVVAANAKVRVAERPRGS